MVGRLRFLSLSAGLICVCCIIVACSGPAAGPTGTPAATANRPTLFVSAPVNGAEVAVGNDVNVQSVSTDAKGVVRIELWVDGILYRMDVTREAEGLPNVVVGQAWPAKELGNHTMLVKAVNRDGVVTESQPIIVRVVTQVATVVTPTPVAVSSAPTAAPSAGTPAAANPTAAPAATVAATTAATAAPTSAATCDPNAVYVADVTIPDGTPVKPGETLNKVWRVRNNGNCAWDASYQLAFSDGAQMGGTAEATVSALAPNATGEVRLSVTAPTAPGVYVSRWRLRAPNGNLFGQTLILAVRVADPNATPTRAPISATPTAKAPPVIAFTGTPNRVAYGDCTTLKWDVDNVVAVKLDGRGVTGHETRQVCPLATTTYKLESFASEGAQAIENELTIEVPTPATAGTAPIGLGGSVDLDTGRATTSDADFSWDTTKSLLPKNGATFALMGARAFNNLPKDECDKAANYSSANLVSSQIPAGIMLCYKTSSGKTGKLRIESVDAEIRLRWVTW